MRILQLIDSLEPGGAERMAVQYANGLRELTPFSGLVATRKEGLLRDQLDAGCPYLFLEKRRTLDLAAVFRLRRFCRSNHVEVLHAHSSSYFIALLVKLVLPRVKIVWHDHNGMSEFVYERSWRVLRLASFFFAGIVSVNQKLKTWAERTLHCPNVRYFPNFAAPDHTPAATRLSGHGGKRILCLANLRPQKDHPLLLDLAVRLKVDRPEWSFHLVGTDFNDRYAEAIHARIDRQKLDNVKCYVSRQDISTIIAQADIGILTSKSEGLPVSLLEFGQAGKAVLMPRTGEIPSVVVDGENGVLAEPSDADAFYKMLLRLIDYPDVRQRLGGALSATIEAQYTPRAVLGHYLSWLKEI